MLVKGEDKNSASHAVDVAGNKNSDTKLAQADTSASQTVTYEPEEIWEPTQEDNAWKYYQYYGEDYESICKRMRIRIIIPYPIPKPNPMLSMFR